MVAPVSVTAPNAFAETALAAEHAVIEAPTSPLTGPRVLTTTLTTKLTAYNAVPGQTDNDPFTTASGAFSNPEVVAARSRDLATKLPYGTVIKIERTHADTPNCMYSKVEDQIGYRVLADAMNPRIVNTVDILLDQNRKVPVGTRMVNPGLALGKCGEATITVVGHIDVKDIPSTQAELASMVEALDQAPTKLAER